MENKNKNIARKAAETAVEADIVVKVGEHTLKVKRPTLRTLISVSAEISKLPKFVMQEGKELTSVIGYAKYCKSIGKVIALLILGARKNTNIIHKFLLWRMENRILDKFTPKELEQALSALFAEMQLADFFRVTIFLNETNLTMPTREMVN